MNDVDSYTTSGSGIARFILSIVGNTNKGIEVNTSKGKNSKLFSYFYNRRYYSLHLET